MKAHPLTRRAFLGAALGTPVAARLAGLPFPAQRERHRVVVSTDIGGSDPDDFQSMVHYLLYADRFDTEGLVSSPWGPGRAAHIHEVIDRYEEDYPGLVRHSAAYPTPAALRAVTRQGALDPSWGRGHEGTTEGSDWIVRCARRDDPRPLYLLVWGTIDDLAQALHDDPSIKRKLRVYYISGPNKKWGLAAYDYIEREHPDLWIVESNSTYRGWFEGGDQRGALGNRGFVDAHVRGRGALGRYFARFREGELKMGDTPSVAYLLHGTPDDPTAGGWGGRYVRAWERPRRSFHRLTTPADRVEQFGILELLLAAPSAAADATASLWVREQEFPASRAESGLFRFRFMPKDAGDWSYTVRSSAPELDGLRGEFTAYPPPPESAAHPSARYPSWWTDDPDPRWAEGPHQGARTVSRWRAAWLADFRDRLLRCPPAPSAAGSR